MPECIGVGRGVEYIKVLDARRCERCLARCRSAVAEHAADVAGCTGESQIRSRAGLPLLGQVALLAVSGYLLAMSVASVVAQRPGYGAVNVLVLIFAWNALKFGWVAVLSPLGLIRATLLR